MVRTEKYLSINVQLAPRVQVLQQVGEPGVGAAVRGPDVRAVLAVRRGHGGLSARARRLHLLPRPRHQLGQLHRQLHLQLRPHQRAGGHHQLELQTINRRCFHNYGVGPC